MGFAARCVSIILFVAWLSIGGCVAAGARVAIAQEAQGDADRGTPTVDERRSGAEAKRITKYTLTPEREAKARALAKVGLRIRLVSLVCGLIVLLAVLRWKVAAKYRDWAEKASAKRFVQVLVFAPLIALTIDVLMLPIWMYGHRIGLQYGLSIQGWGSWFGDWGKDELLSVIFTIVVVWILFWVIAKSPGRWWFYFWLATLPLIVAVVFAAPLVIDPMFHKFEPLQVKNPGLTAELEKMAQHAGESIPAERIFWMGAGEKTTTLNAYVTGLGASKRIVVWDTTIAKLTPAQVVSMAGHEMGHYVLNHIPKGLAFSAVGLFVAFYLGYRVIGWVLAGWGAGLGIRDVGDLASYPALLLVISILATVGEPVGNAYSRYVEHQADQYGLEVTHGLMPNAGQVAAQELNIGGNVDLEDPRPSRLKVLLFYTHPPIEERIQFALHYDPWAEGKTGEFVK
jgi:Zn-dependent protease with chaperone function